MPVAVLNISNTGLSVKVEERFVINLPVLIECDNVVVVGNVKHCIKAINGGYVLGIEICRVVERSQPHNGSAEFLPWSERARTAGAA